jgi:hypothetical protein
MIFRKIEEIRENNRRTQSTHRENPPRFVSSFYWRGNAHAPLVTHNRTERFLMDARELKSINADLIALLTSIRDSINETLDDLGLGPDDPDDEEEGD